MTGALLAIVVAAAGGLGAAARFVVDGAVRAYLAAHRPAANPALATAVVNVGGSFLLGFVVALAGRALLPPEAVLVVGTGFCGGYTTFGTAGVEAVTLVRAGRRRAAALVAFGTLVATVLAAAAGLALGGGG